MNFNSITFLRNKFLTSCQTKTEMAHYVTCIKRIKVSNNEHLVLVTQLLRISFLKKCLN